MRGTACCVEHKIARFRGVMDRTLSSTARSQGTHTRTEHRCSSGPLDSDPQRKDALRALGFSRICMLLSPARGHTTRRAQAVPGAQIELAQHGASFESHAAAVRLLARPLRLISDNAVLVHAAACTLRHREAPKRRTPLLRPHLQSGAQRAAGLSPPLAARAGSCW